MLIHQRVYQFVFGFQHINIMIFLQHITVNNSEQIYIRVVCLGILSRDLSRLMIAKQKLYETQTLKLFEAVKMGRWQKFMNSLHLDEKVDFEQG